MRPKTSADCALPNREVQEYQPKGNRLLNETNPDAVNVTTCKKERVENRSAHLAKNTGQGTSRPSRYRGDRNVPKGSFESQKKKISDPEMKIFFEPQPIRGARRTTSLPERDSPASILKREKAHSEELPSTSRAKEDRSPRRQLDTSCVPPPGSPPKKRKKAVTKQQFRAKQMDRLRRNAKNMNK
ncbi:Oidioi.mRNA.OKI2018_I69.XSR.g16805.t1.cds [Oikopleura dioica]|uniref:Oidioi.mRNA.OKI2018_I69.XSR.g16805.t1.cds n=1 Tax=Oikopleura dioica TaxID=34765 RepID=A0ABN7SJ44_OIKDI|nr:Oidioi.mRNA.OKI2018_I69.XSR.g16805.t1.cds [Oikopleura dioica]